jgi:hypothetical protein
MLLDSAGVEAHATKQKRWPRLAFLTLIHASAARDTQQKNIGPVNYAGPSNKS